ncbi:hypothetical protein BC828DRAFT_396900 [Blastocladiella britannica]|nr:hypothetical protein BC828DRAFT_396900 [Blastocladiella britannica]
MEELDDDNTTDLLGADKHMICDFLADSDSTKLADIEDMLYELTVAKNAGNKDSLHAFMNTPAVLTDNPHVFAWFSYALTLAANHVLADLGMDHAVSPLRCLLLPVFLAFAGHWRAIQNLNAGLSFDFPPAGTLS